MTRRLGLESSSADRHPPLDRLGGGISVAHGCGGARRSATMRKGNQHAHITTSSRLLPDAPENGRRRVMLNHPRWVLRRPDGATQGGAIRHLRGSGVRAHGGAALLGRASGRSTEVGALRPQGDHSGHHCAGPAAASHHSWHHFQISAAVRHHCLHHSGAWATTPCTTLVFAPEFGAILCTTPVLAPEIATALWTTLFLGDHS